MRQCYNKMPKQRSRVRPKSKPSPQPAKVDDSSKLSDVLNGWSSENRPRPTDISKPKPVFTRECGTGNQQTNISSRIGVSLIIFAAGLTLGFGLGVLAYNYHFTASFTETKEGHCEQFKSLGGEALATEQVVDDSFSSGPAEYSTETFQNVAPRDQKIDDLKYQKKEDANFEGVNHEAFQNSELTFEEGAFQEQETMKVDEESVRKESDNLDKDKHTDRKIENIIRNNIRPTDDYQENDRSSADGQEKANVGSKDKLEDNQHQEASGANRQVRKTFTFKDGKLEQETIVEQKSSSRKITTTEEKETEENSYKESKMKDSNPKDGVKSLKSAAASHEPTYLQGLKIRNVMVGGDIVTPQELTNGTGPIRAYIYENFLTPKECEGLMGVHNRHVIESNKDDPLVCFDSINTLRKHLKAAKSKYKVSQRDFTKGTTCMNATFSTKLKKLLKWSYSTAFYPGESKFSTTFEQRVLEATGLRPQNGGKFQITSYHEGIGYKTHTDCIIGSDDKRDRVATILVYLQDVEEGGETKFPELDLSVRPVKGRALVWNNMNPAGDCHPLSVHEAAQVKQGHKFILQRWYYYESFYHLGKRPSEPSLPERNDGQPRVSCDEYENGSCRWYDEWNYDHIIDYQSSKSNLL